MFGCVPLAMRRVETGRWLAEHGCGVLLDDPLLPAMIQYFGSLDAAAVAGSQAAVAAVDVAALTDSDTACGRVVGALHTLTQT